MAVAVARCLTHNSIHTHMCVCVPLCVCVCADEAHYHLHSHMHGRQHDSTQSYTQRLTAFAANKAKILAHNKQVAAGGDTAAATTHTLELNHFADWSRDEFDRVMLPLKWRRDHGYQVQKVWASFHKLFRGGG